MTSLLTPPSADIHLVFYFSGRILVTDDTNVVKIRFNTIVRASTRRDLEFISMFSFEMCFWKFSTSSNLIPGISTVRREVKETFPFPNLSAASLKLRSWLAFKTPFLVNTRAEKCFPSLFDRKPRLFSFFLCSAVMSIYIVSSKEYLLTAILLCSQDICKRELIGGILFYIVKLKYNYFCITKLDIGRGFLFQCCHSWFTGS